MNDYETWGFHPTEEYEELSLAYTGFESKAGNPYITTPDFEYVVRRDGTIIAFDAKTGDRINEERQAVSQEAGLKWLTDFLDRQKRRYVKAEVEIPLRPFG